MNSEDFNKCREFLESQIKEAPENKELLTAYQRLFELKSEFDKETNKAVIEKEIREAEIQANLNAKVHTNNTDYGKAVHSNNTSFNMNAGNNHAANFQHQQTQFASVANNAINNGYLPYQNPSV